MTLELEISEMFGEHILIYLNYDDNQKINWKIWYDCCDLTESFIYGSNNFEYKPPIHIINKGIISGNYFFDKGMNLKIKTYMW